MQVMNFVVSVSANQKQSPNLRTVHQPLDEVERVGVQPLQVIQEQDQRQLGLSHGSNEPPKCPLKSAFGVFWGKRGQRLLLADQQLKLRDQADDQLAARTERCPQSLLPSGRFRLVSCEEIEDDATQRLSQHGVRHVARELIALARGKQGAFGDRLLLKLADDRRLSDTRIARHEDELRSTARHYALEGRVKHGDFSLPPEELLRQKQPVRRVMQPKREGHDFPVAEPFRKAAAEIELEA